MKKSTPEFLTYLSSLSLSLAAAAGGLVAPSAEAATPVPVPQEEISLSTDAADKLATLAARTLNASGGQSSDYADPAEEPWLLWAQWGADPAPEQISKVEPGSLSFIEAFTQVSS